MHHGFSFRLSLSTSSQSRWLGITDPRRPRVASGDPLIDITICGDVERNPGPFEAEDSPSWLVTDQRDKAEEWARIMRQPEDIRVESLAVYAEFFRGKALRNSHRQEPFLVDMVRDGYGVPQCVRIMADLEEFRNQAVAAPYVARDPVVAAAMRDDEARARGAEDARRELAQDRVQPLEERGPESKLAAYCRRGGLAWTTTQDPYVIHNGLTERTWSAFMRRWFERSVVFFVAAFLVGPLLAFVLTLAAAVSGVGSPVVRHWRVDIGEACPPGYDEDRPASMSHQKISRLADYATVHFTHWKSRGWFWWGKSTKAETVPLGVVAEVQNSVGYITDTTKFERYEVRIAQCFNVGLQASRLLDVHGPVLKMLVALAMDEKMRRTPSDDLLDFHVGPTRRVGQVSRF